MLLPKRVKYRRQHRPKTTGRSKGGNYVTFGEFGLQADNNVLDHISSNRICSYSNDTLHETWRESLIKIFPHTPYTKNL